MATGTIRGMPEMSFGRSIRYRRTKLGLSQTRLGELVGRSAAAVRSWEKDASTPSDPSVLQALSAVLGIDQKVLFEKAGVDTPVVETSPTMEEAMGSLAPELPLGVTEAEKETEVVSPDEVDGESDDDSEEIAGFALPANPPQAVTPDPAPGFVAPQQQYVYTLPAPPVAEPTYMEDQAQRQMYRVRNLATLVAALILVIMFLWAFGHGWEALTGWWDDFIGNLQL